jgi:hypothetical protein
MTNKITHENIGGYIETIEIAIDDMEVEGLPLENVKRLVEEQVGEIIVNERFEVICDETNNTPDTKEKGETRLYIVFPFANEDGEEVFEKLEFLFCYNPFKAKDMDDVIEELYVYLELSNDEMQEQTEHLIYLYRGRDGLGDIMVEEIEKHLKETLYWYNRYTEIVEEEKTCTQKFKELIHK